MKTEGIAVTSLIVAIIGAISAIVSSINASRSSKKVELLRHKWELERKAIDERIKNNNELLTTLSDSIKAIQKVKDVIQRIVNSYSNSHHSKVAIDKISAATAELTSCYENKLTELVKNRLSEEMAWLHKAKGSTVFLEDYVKSVLNQKTYTSDLSAEEKERLREWRRELSEIQSKLQSSLYDHFVKCSSDKLE